MRAAVEVPLLCAVSTCIAQRRFSASLVHMNSIGFKCSAHPDLLLVLPVPLLLLSVAEVATN
jgi:hypothetical protein